MNPPTGDVVEAGAAGMGGPLPLQREPDPEIQMMIISANNMAENGSPIPGLEHQAPYDPTCGLHPLRPPGPVEEITYRQEPQWRAVYRQVRPAQQRQRIMRRLRNTQTISYPITTPLFADPHRAKQEPCIEGQIQQAGVQQPVVAPPSLVRREVLTTSQEPVQQVVASAAIDPSTVMITRRTAPVKVERLLVELSSDSEQSSGTNLLFNREEPIHMGVRMDGIIRIDDSPPSSPIMISDQAAVLAPAPQQFPDTVVVVSQSPATASDVVSAQPPQPEPQQPGSGSVLNEFLRPPGRPRIPPGSSKRPYLKWTQELKAKFAAAVEKVGGLEYATAGPVHHAMALPGITTFQVQRHLQWIRLKSNPRTGDTRRPRRRWRGEHTGISSEATDKAAEQSAQALEITKELQKSVLDMRVYMQEIQKHLGIGMEQQQRTQMQRMNYDQQLREPVLVTSSSGQPLSAHFSPTRIIVDQEPVRVPITNYYPPVANLNNSVGNPQAHSSSHPDDRPWDQWPQSSADQINAFLDDYENEAVSTPPPHPNTAATSSATRGATTPQDRMPATPGATQPQDRMAATPAATPPQDRMAATPGATPQEDQMAWGSFRPVLKMLKSVKTFLVTNDPAGDQN